MVQTLKRQGQRWQNLAAGHLCTSARLPGDVAARPSEAFDEAGSDRIARAAITTDLGADDDCEWSFAKNDKLRNKLSWRLS